MHRHHDRQHDQERRHGDGQIGQHVEHSRATP
jgi:hypothetical protein